VQNLHLLNAPYKYRSYAIALLCITQRVPEDALFACGSMETKYLCRSVVMSTQPERACGGNCVATTTNPFQAFLTAYAVLQSECRICT
jgi:hypothetical protein